MEQWAKWGRAVCHFSCGAASAVAAKIECSTATEPEVVIVNSFLQEEHADNRRFLADCETWFGKKVTVLRDTRYGASARMVWQVKGYMKGPMGASCSGLLKREVIDSFCAPDDVHILGICADDDADRIERWRGKPQTRLPLVERGLTKADCLAILERAGIEPPLMYRLGYNNANCIGCCKGGMGYWNKIRRDFPEDFAKCAQIEAEIGPSAYIFYDRKTGERFPLTQLAPNAGKHDEVLPDCSFFCVMAEEEMA